MRRRLDLAASLTGTPSVIFLDEPTTGLDVPSRQVMWQVISGLAGRGVTVFLTTQYLEEADQLADRVAVIDGGRVVAEGPPAELKKLVAGQRLDLLLADAVAFGAAARRAGGRVISSDPARLTLSVPTDGTAAAGHRDHPRPAAGHAGRREPVAGAGLVRRPAGRGGHPVRLAVHPAHGLTGGRRH